MAGIYVGKNMADLAAVQEAQARFDRGEQPPAFKPENTWSHNGITYDNFADYNRAVNEDNAKRMAQVQASQQQPAPAPAPAPALAASPVATGAVTTPPAGGGGTSSMSALSSLAQGEGFKEGFMKEGWATPGTVEMQVPNGGRAPASSRALAQLIAQRGRVY